ncbi:MAG TPA: SET domain-containing protein [Flavisolibacter sp.]|nr:SET domain-containing protein [Flavisolibacter sp.]
MHTTNDEQEHKYLSMLVKGSLYFDVVVGKSKIHGKGLYATKKIPARKKIGSLAGEIISKKTAREKAKLNESISIVELWNGKALDASNVNNELRYINHSCKPNTYMRTIDHHVEFYALRSIKPNEELTCNYGPTHHDGKKECRCGAPGCKGFI